MADKFQTTMYVTAYELARDGMADEQIGRALGVQGQTFRRWLKRRPALADAVARGRHARDPGDEMTFHQYIYDHISPHLRVVWDKINECENLENGVERVEALLKNHGIRARQHLFLYALTQSMFNVSQSLRKLGIPRKRYENWCANDPEFAELMDEIHWYKENFFEQAFIGRVTAGDTAAIIHAVKTKCRDRGYNDKVEIVHSGSIDTKQTVSIVDLDLDIETRRKVLEALRKKTAAEQGATPND
jgi:hypothetical protein